MVRHIGRTPFQWKRSFRDLQALRRRFLHGPVEDFETARAREVFLAYLERSYKLLMDEVNRTHEPRKPH